MGYFRTFCVTLALLALFIGCAATRRPHRQQYFEHEVRYQGETLSAIASWYTGHADDWALIIQHNPDIDVYKLRRGSIVRIPVEMLVREDPFPKRLAQPAKPMVKGAEGASRSAPTEADQLNVNAESRGSVSAEKVATAAAAASAPDSSHTPALSAEQENEVRRKSREELFRELLPATATPGS